MKKKNPKKNYVIYLKVVPPCAILENSKIHGRDGAFDDDAGLISG